MVGRVYGNWTLEELIDDSTGNGVVWRVSDRTGQQGAIKILKSFDITEKTEKRRKRFINEIKKLEYIMELGIDGVMPILDHNAESDPPWFVMPFANKLEPGENRLEWALEALIKVTRCIADLHEKGIVHRDIKPNNIIVLNGKVVVADFGLSRVAEDETLTRTGEGVGSFGYIAPECVGHSDEPLFKCDVYALGKTAWMLLTGAQTPPTGDLSHQDDLLANRGINSSTISVDRLNDLLVAATARDPNDRPTAR